MDYNIQTDEQLIAAFYEGGREALSVLYERHKQGVFNFVYRICANRADAEDILGEVFIRVCEGRSRFTPQATFKTWLYTIARNVSFDHARKQRNKISLWFKKPGTDELQSFEIEDTQDSARQLLDKTEAALFVQKVIARLPDDQKQALVLREYHEMNYEQIASVLGCTLANVKVLIYRARVYLRQELPDSIKEGS